MNIIHDLDFHSLDSCWNESLLQIIELNQHSIIII